MYFGQQDQQDIAKKLLQKEDLKKEMNLPKTKLTKKGLHYFIYNYFHFILIIKYFFKLF
jgi:hypothetical protein